MNTKFLLSAALLGGVVLFAFSAAYHMLLPWETWALSEFKDSKALNEAVRANAPRNGMYMTREGVFAAVAFLPDSSDKTAQMGPAMVREFGKDILVALLLALILSWTRTSTALGRGALLGAVGLAAAVSEHISDWNWYGFSGPFTLLTMGDIIIGWFLAGLAIGWLMGKMHAAPAAAAVRAAG